MGPGPKQWASLTSGPSKEHPVRGEVTDKASFKPNCDKRNLSEE